MLYISTELHQLLCLFWDGKDGGEDFLPIQAPGSFHDLGHPSKHLKVLLFFQVLRTLLDSWINPNPLQSEGKRADQVSTDEKAVLSVGIPMP